LESIMSDQQAAGDKLGVNPGGEGAARESAGRAADAVSQGNGLAGAREAIAAARERPKEAIAEVEAAGASAPPPPAPSQSAASEDAAVARDAETAESAPPPKEDPPQEDNYIQRRVAARKKARAVELKKKEAEDELKRHLMARALRAKPKSAPVEVKPFWPRVWSGLVAFILSRTLHTVLAGSVAAAMVGWLGLQAYTLYQAQTDAAFRDHCLENNMQYVSGSRKYCYDSKRFAHQITDDGVTGRLSLDWKVNERLLALASKAAERAAAKPSHVESPALIGLAAGTIAELSAQLTRNDDAPREPGAPAGATVSYLYENGPKIIHIRQRRPGDDGIP
jgi:hypothetical protein